ncbi:hypothetical protein N799_05360 [Lysobacter arseniciresistens ZS79]|uniref:Uncharacterized protein n=1 Tax=Lysobacter arseniciresistens ZS79 TaxID=913325 RepID=A0A0A0F2X0_9GAMM|nr:ankyrin repeat domain-containing protein [Lysobacter arseniciresistens]KGM57491.1 hypothetical protein N799_05360 [Lysobacter arseniciresistens ZS79]
MTTHPDHYPDHTEAEILDLYAIQGHLTATALIPKIRDDLVGDAALGFWQQADEVYQRHLDKWIESPLHMAARGGHLEHMCVLIEQGMHVDTLDDCGVTALHSAVMMGQAQTSQALILMGADINAQDRFGMSPLHWATMTLEEQAAIDLVEAGANLYLLNNDGETPLDHIYDPDFEARVMAAHTQFQANQLAQATPTPARQYQAPARRM